ncbi:phage integrase [Hafnia alvei]|uniref:phage integrase n=1 Tax=Hafnia alvei TaxID=569 RepID=UPI00103435A7|nr:tyrosine-type recombinase/integrase [Hafnia alvei]TBL60027.1 site-specific integrase [Hafnia alvei]
MSIKKLEDGRYEVDIRPSGRNGKRIRRKFDKRHEALAFERYTNANHHTKEWLSKPADKRPLSDLIDIWWRYHGKHRDHGTSALMKLERIARMMDNPATFQIDRARITAYRSERLAEGVKASTINREMTAISGMFTDLIESDLYAGEHPVRGAGKLKEENTEMSYLNSDEIATLLSILTGDNRKIAILCLSTGARWGEATKLKREHVVHNVVTFVQTKNGKRRSVPISSEVAAEILQQKSGLLFPKASYCGFRSAVNNAKPDLPNGQSTHALRHTFATHFMMNGGNIITLQKILGHSKIEQTMNYAHFAPDFLQDAISYNPLQGKADV